MNEHTLRVLEFDKVLGMLADETAFSLGRELARDLRPASEYAVVLALQAETAEMTLIEQMGLDIALGGVRDLRPLLQSAAIGQALEPTELQDAANTLATAYRARQLTERLAERTPRIAERAAVIGDFRVFVA